MSRQISSVNFNFYVNPSAGKSMLTWADINAAYQGWFPIPILSGSGTEFGYSTGIQTQLPNGNLLMQGHLYNPLVHELSIPSTLNGSVEAGSVGPWRNIIGNFTPAGTGTPWRIQGMLAQGSIIRTTQWEFYNGSGTDYPSQGLYDTAARSLYKTSVHGAFTSGYMSPTAPSIGYDYLAGNQGSNGAATNRWGPNLFAVKATGSVYPTKTLVHHPDQARQYPGWWIANCISSMIWVETATKWGVLCFGYEGLSGFGYKANNDPYMGSGGYTATSYQSFCWIYNPKDMIDVMNGVKSSWSILPVEKKVLTFGNGNETFNTMFRGTPTDRITASINSNNRIIVSVAESYAANQYSWTPRCYVFQL